MSTIRTLREEELQANVFEESGPVVLDFYNESCAPCRTLEPQLEDVAERFAQRFPGLVRVYRVDVARETSVAARFNVESLPTVLVSYDGSEVERLDGIIREEDLTRAFERAADRGRGIVP